MTGYKPDPVPRAPLKFHDPMELSFIAPMPNRITSATVPNFMELRQTWRMGIQKIEMDFNELLQKLNMDFEAKSMEFSRIAKQMEDNH